MQALFGSLALLFKLISSPARYAQITLMKFNITRENTLTKSGNKTPSGMLISKTMVVRRENTANALTCFNRY